MLLSRFNCQFGLWCIALCAGTLSASVGNMRTAQAQVAPLPMQGFVSANGRLRVDASNAALLLELERRRDVKVIELELKQAQLRQVPQAWESLSRWVAGGGVVLLHSDAAQLFGFRTVTARERTRERAGQLFGRARASLPFGAHPLLWGGISQTAEGRGRGAMGVYLVYYRLQSGDQLAIGHGAGVPLLSVTDLTAATNGEKNEPPLYAAMMAPYGDGWAMMVPRTIEARADGATFGRNLDAFLAALPSSTTSNEAWTSVAADAVEMAHRRTLQNRSVDWNKLASAFGEALLPLPSKQWPSSRLPAVGAWQSPPPKATPRTEEAAPDESENEDEAELVAKPNAPTPERLLMQRSEAMALSQIFARGADDSQNRALLEQLAGRIALQRGQAPGSQVPDVARNTPWFSALIALDGQRRKRLAPTVELEAGERPDVVTAQIQGWNGIFAATAAHAFGVDARSRALAWREALHWWNLALGQPLEPLELPQGFNPDPAAPDAPDFYPMVRENDRSLGSLSPALVRQWQKLARWEFNEAAHQPPMTLAWQGPHGEQNTISMYPVDAALSGLPTPVEGNEYPVSNSFRWRLIQRTIQLLDSGTRYDMGWGADQVEVNLRPEPFYTEDIGAGALDWESMVNDSDVRLRNSSILMWSSPSPLTDQITGVAIAKQRFTYLESNPANPYDVIYTKKTVKKQSQEKLKDLKERYGSGELKFDRSDLESVLE